MIDSQIALGVKPIQVASPVDLLTKQANYRNLISEGDLHQQVIADNQEKLKQSQIQTAKAQRDQQDAERVRQAFVQTNGDPKATIDQAIKNGAGPDAITGLQKHFEGLAKDAADTDSKVLANRAARNNQILPLIDQAQQLATTNPQAYMQAWPQIAQQAAAIDPEAAKHADPSQPWTPQQLATAKALHMTDQYFVSQETQKRADQKAQEDAAAASRAAELQPALVKKGQNEAITTAPNAAGLTPEQRQTAQQAADTLAQTKLRDEEAARHNVAGETVEKVKTNIEQAKNAREERIYDQTYGAGADPALVGVTAAERKPALGEASKAGKSYLDAQATADQMQSLIDLARSGDKAAGSNLPLVGLETLNAINGIKRINRTEVDQYQGAGDLLDRIKGKIGKLAIGQPISSDVLDDIEKMHQVIRDNSTKAFRDNVTRINGTYRASFDPDKLVGKSAAPGAPSGGSSLSTGHKVGDVVNVGGKRIKITKVLPNDKFEGDEQ